MGTPGHSDRDDEATVPPLRPPGAHALQRLGLRLGASPAELSAAIHGRIGELSNEEIVALQDAEILRPN